MALKSTEIQASEGLVLSQVVKVVTARHLFMPAFLLYGWSGNNIDIPHASEKFLVSLAAQLIFASVKD